MKKWISCIFLFIMLISIAATPAFTEESDNTGEWLTELPKIEGDTAPGEAVDVAPIVPEGLEKTIFGSDDRITISNPSQYPFSAISYIVAHFECGCDMVGGSGFLVGPDTVFTAAHCVVCHKHGKWAQNLTFYFGYQNDRNYLYKYNGKWKAYAGTTFPNGYSASSDYAVVKLEKNVSATTGCFGVKWYLSDSELRSTYVYLTGFRQGVLHLDQGFIEPYGNEFIIYHLDTEPGNSGCPLYTSDYYAVGINISQNENHNRGYRMTTDVRYAYDYVK